MAMAAGEPKQIRDEYACYTRGPDRLPAGRLVQLPAAVAGDLPHRPRAVRVTDVPAGAPPAPPARPPRGGPSRFLDTASPEALFVLSAVAQYVGATIAVLLFDEVAPQTVAWLRVIGAAVAVLAVSGRGLAGLDRAASSPRRRIFGIATAAMNTFFYLAIDRTDLGKSVAIEFIGPIAVAAVDDPHPPQRRRRSRSPRSASSCSAASSSAATPPAWPTCSPRRRAGPRTSSSGSRVAQLGARRRRARHRAGDRRVVLTPFGAPGSGAVWTSPRLLVACLARRRVLQRHRLRHRPARAAPDPRAPLLGAARAAAGDRGGDRLDRPRPAPVGARPRRHRASCSSASASRTATSWRPRSRRPTRPDRVSVSQASCSTHLPSSPPPLRSGARPPGQVLRCLDNLFGSEEDPVTVGHRVAMLGTGLIGDFYTMTLHGRRSRDRVEVVYSRSVERGEAFRDALGHPARDDEHRGGGRPPRRRHRRRRPAQPPARGGDRHWPRPPASPCCAPSRSPASADRGQADPRRSSSRRACSPATSRTSCTRRRR